MTYKQDKELSELRHKFKMEEIKAEMELAKYQHDMQLEVIRIKSAEINRTQQRREFEKYSKPQ